MGGQILISSCKSNDTNLLNCSMPEAFDFTWYEMALLVLAGFAAGIINTLAGSGTLFTFGAMLFLGIPITLANTTNRIGVFFQNIAGIASYLKYGKHSFQDLKLIYVLPTLVGAMLGAYMATGASEALLNLVAASVMCVLGLDLAFDLKKHFFSGGTKNVTYPAWLIVSLMLIVGFYGGFIQIGIGLLMIAVLYRFVSPDLRKSNFLKLVLILIYTIPTTLLFILKGQIIWIPALLLSIGQVIGAYLAGFYSNVSPDAEKWIKKLMIIMIFATITKIVFW